MRKLDAFVARAREVQVYAKAASVLRPRHFSARRPGLDVAFSQLRRLLPHVPPTDFPDLAAVRRNRNLRKPRAGLLTALDAMLAHDVPNLVAEMQPSPCVAATTTHRWDHHDQGRQCRTFDALFASLKPIAGKVTGAAAKHEMIKSKLPNSCLRKIWKLADADKDGMLDITEFTVAMQLIELKVAGCDLPYQVSSDVFSSTTQQPSALRPRSAHATLMIHTCNDDGGGTPKRILDDVPELPERSITTPSCHKPFDVCTASNDHDSCRKAQSYDEINFPSEFVQSEPKDLEVLYADKNEPQTTSSIKQDSSDTLSTSSGANSCSTCIEEDVKCREDLTRLTVAESYKTSKNIVPACGENRQHIQKMEVNCPLTTCDCGDPHNYIDSTHSSTDCCKRDDCCAEAVVGDNAHKQRESTTYADLCEPLDEICEHRTGPTEKLVDLKYGNCDGKLYTDQSAAGETRHGILSSSWADDNFFSHRRTTSEGNENIRNGNAANVTGYDFCAADLKTENQCSSSSTVMRSSSLKCGIATYNLGNERSAFLDRSSLIHKSPVASVDCCEEREPFYNITNISDSGNLSMQCVLPPDVIGSEEMRDRVSGGKTDLRSRSAEGNRDRNREINPKLSPCFHDNLVRVRFMQNEYACNCEDCSNFSNIPGSACSTETSKSPLLAFHYDDGFTRKEVESAQKIDRECEVELESRLRDHKRSKISQLTYRIGNNEMDGNFGKMSGYQPKVKSGEELTDDTQRTQDPYTCVVTDAAPEREDFINKSMNGISWDESECGWSLPAGSSLNATERDIWPGSEPNLSTGVTCDNQKSPLHQRKWWTEPRKRANNLFSKFEVPQYNREQDNAYIKKYSNENSDWILTGSPEVGDDRERDEGSGFNERHQCNELEKSNMTQFNRSTLGSMKPRFGIMSDSQNDTRGLTSHWKEGTSAIPLPVIRRQESTRNRKSNAAITMETVTKIRDDDSGGGASSSTTERQSWSSEVNAAANRSRHPKRVLLSAAEESFVKNSDFYRFVDEMQLSDTSDAYPYVSSDLLHKSSHGETTSMSSVKVNSLGLTALSSASLSNSRHSDNLSYHQHREPTCWHEMRSSKENCGCSDADENRRRDGEEFSSSRVGGNGDTSEGKVCPERDFNDCNQYRQDEEQ